MARCRLVTQRGYLETDYIVSVTCYVDRVSDSGFLARQFLPG
jgi:hypothetical protein